MICKKYRPMRRVDFTPQLVWRNYPWPSPGRFLYITIKSWTLSGNPQRYTEPPWPSAELCTVPFLPFSCARRPGQRKFSPWWRCQCTATKQLASWFSLSPGAQPRRQSAPELFRLKPGGSLRWKPMLTCVYGRFSNGPISLKFMIKESHPFQSLPLHTESNLLSLASKSFTFE